MDTIHKPKLAAARLFDLIAETRNAEQLAVSTNDARKQRLSALKAGYERGELAIDPDDPRTIVGLTAADICYIRGQLCDTCSKVDCDCDKQTMDARDTWEPWS